MYALHIGGTHHIVSYPKEGELWLLPSRKVQFRFSWSWGEDTI